MGSMIGKQSANSDHFKDEGRGKIDRNSGDSAESLNETI
jgi:hypothetical protein